MKFSHYLAQDIVEEMKDIINQDLNYFDDKGFIIASTNKERIGTFHEGAKKVLDTKKELIIEYDNQYKGAKKGINVPVYFENEVVGVIGITGEKDEVEQYGKIIQRITNILIKDGYIREQKKAEKDNKRQFIEELLFRYHINEKSLLMWAGLLDFDLEINRFVMVIRISNKDDSYDIISPKITENVYKSIKEIVSVNNQNLMIQSGTNIIIIHRVVKEKSINKIAEDIIKKIEFKYRNINLYIGIGTETSCLDDIKKSYNEAKKALDIGYVVRRNKISKYTDLDIGLLIDDLSKETIDEYISKIFKNLNEEDIKKYSHMLASYINHNGSINKAADELFIHKNTLQYRLNKLQTLTGYNPRNLRDMVVLYLAFILGREVMFENWDSMGNKNRLI